MYLVVAVAPIDVLDEGCLAIASEDDIVVSKEVLVEGVSAVLVVSEDVLISSVDGIEIALVSVEVGADEVTVGSTVEEGVSNGRNASNEIIITGASVGSDITGH